MLKNLTIKARLLLLAMLGMVFTVLVGAAGYWGESTQSVAVDEVVTNATAIRNHMEADMRHEGILADVLAALRAGAAARPDDLAAVEKEFVEHAASMRGAIAANQKLTLDEPIKKQMQVVNPALEQYIEKAKAIIARAGKDVPGAQADFPEFKASFDKLEKEQDVLSDLIQASDKLAKEHAEGASKFSRGSTVVLTLAALLALGGASFFLVRSIIIPLRRMEDYMGELSQGRGDLTRRLPQDSNDEIGRITGLFNAFIGQLHDMVVHMKHSADTVSDTSGVLSTQSGEIKRRAGQLADRVMQISAATEEMSVSVSEVANSVSVTSTAAERTRSVAAQGKSGVISGVQLTQRMVEQVKTSATGIRDLNGLVQRIGSMANTIKEIADQTNLLALNAAIEAARAGEQGRGFAVVADEVRKLAERTSSTTADISATISQIQGATTNTVNAMQDVEQNVSEAAGFMREEEGTLDQIVGAADEVSRMATHIAAAAREQSTAVEESARGMEQVSTLSEENSAAVLEFDHAAHALTRAASELQKMVAQFQVEAP